MASRPRLPPPPDFDAIEAAAAGSADRRAAILELIGRLVLGWSNNESMLIYLLMLLLDTDETSAVIVFATLNTTRARLDLIERLAKAKLRDDEIRRELDRLLDAFGDCTRMRNEFNHCIYTFNEKGEITQTHSLRIQDVRGRIRIGSVKRMDPDRVQEIRSTIDAMTRLNRDIWTFLGRLEAHLAAGRAQAAQPAPAASVSARIQPK